MVDGWKVRVDHRGGHLNDREERRERSQWLEYEVDGGYIRLLPQLAKRRAREKK